MSVFRLFPISVPCAYVRTFAHCGYHWTCFLQHNLYTSIVIPGSLHLWQFLHSHNVYCLIHFFLKILTHVLVQPHRYMLWTGCFFGAVSRFIHRMTWGLCASGTMNALWHSVSDQFRMAINWLSTTASQLLGVWNCSPVCSVAWETAVPCWLYKWVELYRQCTLCVLWVFGIEKLSEL